MLLPNRSTPSAARSDDASSNSCVSINPSVSPVNRSYARRTDNTPKLSPSRAIITPLTEAAITSNTAPTPRPRFKLLKRLAAVVLAAPNSSINVPTC